MRISQWVPFYGPSRHSDRPVIQFIAQFGEDEIEHAAADTGQLTGRLDKVLLDGGVIEPGESLKLGRPGEDPGAWLAGSYCRMALLLQRKCGHEVDFFRVRPTGTPGSYLCAFGQEHADVGMTACKLAWELCTGKRRQAGPPFRTLKQFASGKTPHPDARHLVREAMRRGIPWRRPEFEPFPSIALKDWIPMERTGRNGLVLLGHSRQKTLLDGFRCLGPGEKCAMMPELPPGLAPEDRAERVIESLFPAGSRADLPITAITGTNGKTTTSRMVAHIFGQSGHEPGLACSDGLYVNGQNLWPGERGGMSGHSRLLERNDIDMAVLETTLGTLHQTGLAFAFCDVAICLNISSDHDGEGEIETLDEIAEIKRSLVERARNAVVLYGDDHRCLDMMPYVKAGRICLVSATASEQELDRRSASTDACYVNDRGEVVLRNGSKHVSLGALEDMPAGRYGTASHNTVNAMHAMAAAFYAGIAPDLIGAAMQTFEFTFDNTPARWNVHDNGQFTVIFDCVHNVAGFRRMCACIDQEKVAGRKLLLFSFPGDRRPDMLIAAASEVAGHFDHYYVRPGVTLGDWERGELLGTIKERLMANGVAEECITLLEDKDAAGDLVLAEAGPGDLVMMKANKDEYESLWRKIIGFNPSLDG